MSNVGKRKLIDNTIYTFDIETTSYCILNNTTVSYLDYLNLNDKEKKICSKQSCMYIWMFSVNDVVYYGRNWKEFLEFLSSIEENNPDALKYVFVHNLAFEFQFLKGILSFENVIARKSHKVIRAKLKDYNIEFRCTYYMSNASLDSLTRLYQLPIQKKVGYLDYTKIRHSRTKLTQKELEYCEYDCLVLYYYIKKELDDYEYLKNIPNTSTGKVRRELKDRIRLDYNYKRLVRNSINVDPHVFNMLQDSFMGGYTHANWIFADEILDHVDSYDETSAYPYVLVAYKYPSSEFKQVNIHNKSEMSANLAYLLRVKFSNLKCKYYNSFISASKCKNIKNAIYDNGRIVSADSLEITLTDIDFYFYLDAYTCNYEILECYFANYSYLPRKFVNFILEKYVNKTQYKGIPEKELEYMKEKNKFNSLYGMSVTNTIRDEVIYDDISKKWIERDLTNEEIINALLQEKKDAFLSFAYGVWVTAYARDNLLRRVIELDEYVVYCDTDSCKLVSGYNKDVFFNYNKAVLNRLNFISQHRKIDIDSFKPKDIKGIEHPLGLFELECTYDNFITQGAKKYAYQMDNKIHITVAGVPKKASNSLVSLKDFKDDYVFQFKDTNKNILIYNDEQISHELIDYQGNKMLVQDVNGCVLLPTTYVLSKSNDYVNLLTSNSSKRARFKERMM